LGCYFNDEWKVDPHVVVNLGMRYDFQLAPTEPVLTLSYFVKEKNSISDRVAPLLDAMSLGALR